MTDKHQVVFYGEIIEGQNLETVKKNLGTLFKMDTNKIDRLLSKSSILIKKDIDFQTASKYQEMLKKAGAICKIEPMIKEPIIRELKTTPVSAQPDESQGKYSVIFYGELEEGHDLTFVKKRLADLFKKDLSKIDEFLSKIPAIIKKNVDLDTALNYREMLKNAGAVCLIKPVGSEHRPNPVLEESEMNSEPPPLNPSINEQSFPESAKLKETSSELPNMSGTEKKAPSPSGKDPNEKVHESESESEQTQSQSRHITCPQCHFKQEYFDKCVHCGFILKDCCKLVSQKQHVKGDGSERLSSGGTCQATENQPDKHSVNFFKRLFNLNKEAGKEIIRLIIGSAIIGAIVGYMWGGLYDPWQLKGLSAAWLNSLLFGGWGLIEVAGVLIARNLRHAKGRIRLVFNGALWGGIYISLFMALQLVKDVSSLESILLNIITGLVAGFLIGGLISAISTINLSGIMALEQEKTMTT